MRKTRKTGKTGKRPRRGGEERARPPTRVEWPDLDPFVLTPQDKSQAYVPVLTEHLEGLKRAIRSGKVTVVVGERGLGKTTLCERAVADLKREEFQTVPVLLRGAAYGQAEDFVRGIQIGLGLDPRGSRAELVGSISDWVAMHSERLVVFVDDASECADDPPVARELGDFLRAVADIGGITLVLNGEPDRMDRFLQFAPALADRVQARVVLRPLGGDAVERILRRRAELGGVDGLITDDAYGELVRLSRGNPRSALKLASRAYELAREKGVVIDAGVVRRVGRKGWA